MLKLFSATILFAVVMNPAKTFSSNIDTTTLSRTVSIRKDFTRIIVNGDVDVFFVKKGSKEIIIEERALSENTIKVKNKDGTMTINSKEFYRNKKPVVYIPVANLEQLEVNGDGDITMVDMLTGKQLKVIVNGASDIVIRTLGKVDFESAPEIDLNFKKVENTNLSW